MHLTGGRGARGEGPADAPDPAHVDTTALSCTEEILHSKISKEMPSIK